MTSDSVGPRAGPGHQRAERHGYIVAEVLITRFIPITQNKHPRTAREQSATREGGTLFIRASEGLECEKFILNIFSFRELLRPFFNDQNCSTGPQRLETIC